ncbi:hypothetical protein [Streptomyces sp. rh34]|uniref:hypothetical protein n=1 Tax=Streptomyces sp. rh34 TaxID=2034272 RepID=UPI00117F1885|nr:hypothetical protein [Streptomyces sp. rh34]
MDGVPTGMVVFVCVVMAPVTLLMWALAVSEWRELRSPPKPRDPAVHYDLRLHSWKEAPAALHRWQEGGPVGTGGSAEEDVRVAEILAVLDGKDADEGAGVHTRLRLRLPDGEETTLHTDVRSARNVRAGTFLPVKPVREGVTHVLGDTWATAADLSGHAVGRVLLRHRRALGLIDDEAAEAVDGGRPEDADLVEVRPTGEVRAGHVEVVITARCGDHGPVTVRGLLRPEEIATARHTGRVPVVRSRGGRWELWPAWF